MPQHVLLALTIPIEIPVVPTSAAIIGLVALLTTYFLIKRDRQSPATISRSQLDYQLKVLTGVDLSKTYYSKAQEIHFSASDLSPVTKWLRIVSLLIAFLVASASYIVGYVLNHNPFRIVCNISAGVLAILVVINLFIWLASLVDFSISINLKPTTGESRHVLSLVSSDNDDSFDIRAIREALRKEPGRRDLGSGLLDFTLSILAGIISGVITAVVLNSVKL